MEQHILDYAKARYSAKAYDTSKKVSADDMEKLKEILLYSPSSVNVQPWHFVIAESDEAKAKVAKATEGNFAFNTQSLLDASHIIVFATKLDMDDAYLDSLTAKEAEDGRYNAMPEVKDQMHGARKGFIDMMKQHEGVLQNWMAKQTYLNLGQFMLAAAAMGIDSTPMEGFDPTVLDTEFELRDAGYTATVIVPIGYRNEAADYNANIPKSRFNQDDMITIA